MWLAIAEENLNCTECSHNIRIGRRCLSQMPMDMPEGFKRDSFENFCVDCPKCRREKKQPCYVRGLHPSRAREERIKERVTCACCGKNIPKDTRVTTQKYYVWPEFEPEPGKGTDDSRKASRPLGVAAAVAVRAPKAGTGGWSSLSHATQMKFRTAGLGGARGMRTETMARRLYKSIPKLARNSGEKGINAFMAGKHASHIRSVANAPNRAKQPSNIVFESAQKNLKRGSRNMTAKEINAAKSSASASAINVGLKSVLRNVARMGVIASAIEAPIAGLENFFHWRRGRKTGGKAVKDALKSTAATGAVVGAITGGIGLASRAGLVVSLGPFGIPLAIIGGALFGVSILSRIFGAAKRDLPLYECVLYFCKGRTCKTKFAKGLTEAARK